MDTRLAMRLTRSFMDQLEADITAHLDKDVAKNKKKLTGKLLEKYLIHIAKTKGVIKHKILLNKTKSYLLAVTFDKFSYHPDLERKEKLLIGSIQHFGLKSKSERNPILFTISHHCVQRILERTLYDGPQDQEDIRKAIYSEIDYLPIFTGTILNIELLAGLIDLDGSPIDIRAVFNMMKDIPIMVPTKNGVLIGQVINTYIHIKTFLSDDMLSTENMAQKQRLMKYLDPFVDSHLIYWPKTHECLKQSQILSANVILDALALIMLDEIELALKRSTKIATDKNKILTLFRLIRLQNSNPELKKFVTDIFYNQQGESYEKLMLDFERHLIRNPQSYSTISSSA